MFKSIKITTKILKNKWDEIYKKYKLEDIPWTTKKPNENIIKLVKEKEIKSPVLDMCSGTGTNSIYLASNGYEVYGIDISKTAVDIANKTCNKKNLNCKYFVGNVLKKKFNKKFNFIYDRGCFHHLPKKERKKYIKKVYNLLTNKGKLYLECFSNKNKFIFRTSSKKDIINYFSKFFKIIYFKNITHTPKNKNKIYLYAIFMKKI